MRRALLSLLVLSGVAGCGPAKEAPATASPPDTATAQAPLSTSGLTPDFRSWLAANGYSSYDFARDDLAGSSTAGSYGGKASASDTVVNQPVIFIHGNSDLAVGSTSSSTQTGWTASINYFLAHGYKPSELYATTWGPADALQSAAQYHSKPNVMQVRKFIEAVKAYTGASKVDIISHSMGVTLARKAILGGTASDSLNGGSYSVGASLTSSVDAFVGIAGANLGLASCYLSGPTTPTCGSTNGLYPGVWNGISVSGRSAYLNNLLGSSGFEGGFRYAMFSTVDEVIGGGDLVYGSYTSRIPGETNEVVFSSAPYGHFGCKDQTAYYQLQMVKNHTTN